MQRGPRRRLPSLRALLAVLVTSALAAASLTIAAVPAQAAGEITAKSLGWSILGLDSNRVTSGPNQYPIGTKACNTSGTSQTVTGTWQWGTTSANIYLASNSPATLSRTIAPGSCAYFYWTVEVFRDASSYFKSATYRIKLNYGAAPGTDLFVPDSNGTYRTVYVEKFVSQFRNAVTSISGPGIGTNTTTLYQGQEYQYTVTGSTAPSGYEQSVFATIFPPSMFEILSISTGYSADSSPLVDNPNDQTYADGCGWNSETRSCTGSGKAGGVMTTVYRVKLIGTGSVKLQSEIYDFSGSSFHYNADYASTTSNPTIGVQTNPYSLNVDKTVSPATFDAAGDVLTYTITVSNTGASPVQGLTVTDPLISPLMTPSPGSKNCGSAQTLGSGSVLTCSGTYTVTAADVSRGFITNTATAQGQLNDKSIAFGRDLLTTASDAPPGITVDKFPSNGSGGVLTSFSSIGQLIPYNFVVTNSGQTQLNNIGVTDSKILGPITCPVTTLTIGASTTCTGNYFVTQADFDAGKIDNTATATGLPPNGVPVSDTDTHSLPGPAPTPQAEVVKSTTTANYSVAGDKIRYRFVVTNTGDVVLTNVGISDALLANDPPPVCASTTLAPGASTDCFATHTVTQAEIDSGTQIQNSAKATATPSRGTLIAAMSNVVTVPETEPWLNVVKTASATTYATIGQQVDYTIITTNRGTADLTNIQITDPGTALTCTTPDSPFSPGDSVTCTGTHLITQADIDRGYLINTATATGTAPQGQQVTDEDSATLVGPEATPGLTISKTAVSPSYSLEGDKIQYEFTLANTGNVTLNDVKVVDPLLDGPAVCPSTTLAAGQSMTCSGRHTVTAAEATQAFVSNTATADATPTRGILPAVTPATADVPRIAAGLKVTKTADKTTYSQVGDVITFTVTASNRGAAAIDQFTLVDLDGVTLSGPNCTFPRTLAGSQSISCTGTHTVTQADIDRGLLTNTAYGSGVDSTTSQELFDVADVSLTGPSATASLSISKTGTPYYRQKDDTIDYTFTVRNTGTVTISDIHVLDPSLDAAAVCAKTSLAPAESTTCTGSHTVTTSDVTAGSVVNTASVTGLPARGALGAVEEASFTSTLRVPRLNVQKSVVAPTPSNPAVGDTITYSITVTNNGDLDLTDVVLTDPKATVVCDPASATSTGTSLAVGASFTCSATHVVTQSDFNAASGTFTNTAFASGKAGTGTVTDSSDADSTLKSASPAMTLVKSAAESVVYVAGDVITYTIKATNTGDVTLNDVTVSDTNATEGTGCGPLTLAPGAHTDCVATHTVTAGDITAGKIDNTAGVTATPTRGTFTEVQSNTVTVDVAVPGISVTKEAVDGAGDPLTSFSTVGQVVPYKFTVTNTGETALTSVSVTDTKITGTITCGATSLAVGASTTCTGDYTVTQTDMDSGSVQNTATASGLPPKGAPVTDTDSHTLDAPPANPGLSITKTAVSSSYSLAGDTIDYSFDLENTGDVTLSSVAVSDAQLDNQATCPATTLEPGHSMTCTGTHTVTQAEEGQSQVSNTATATATPARGTLPAVSPSAVDVPRIAAGLTVTKSADATTFTAVGDVITFTVTAENRGTVDITNYTLVDLDPEVSLGGNGCVLTGSLAVAEKVTCTGTKTIDQADIDAGLITNTAEGSGTSAGQAVSDTAQVSVTGPEASPSLTITKTGTATYLHAGDTLTYSFTVKNTGNVTLSSVAVVDAKLDSPATCTATTLAPDASTTCSGTHRVTSLDVANETVVNTATATAHPERGTLATVTPAEFTSALLVGELTVAKTLTSPVDPAPAAGPGDTLMYAITVTNTGDVDLTSVTVTDPGADTLTCLPADATTQDGVSLATGASISCTAEHKVTQTEFNTSGTHSNTATATGKDPGLVTVSDADTATSPLATADPSLTLTKTASESKFYEAGDVINYTITARNDGNVTLTDVLISDDNAVEDSADTGCGPVTLAPGESAECSATHTVTVSDVGAAKVDNTAGVTGVAPRGNNPSATSEKVTVTLANPGLQIVKTARSAAAAPGPGDTITYDITVTNSGDVGLTAVTVTDAKADTLTCDPQSATGDGTALAANAQITCVATHVVTHAEFDKAGTFRNTASTSGFDAAGRQLSDTDSAEVTLEDTDPALSVTKSAAESAVYKAGDVIHYTITVNNTGNIGLTGVSVTDPNAVEGTGCGPVDLAPGESTECLATHTVTAEDVTAGKVENVASASGTPARGTGSPNADSQKVTVPVLSGKLTVLKEVTSTGTPGPNDTIAYKITVTNSGDSALSGVVVTDTGAENLTCSPAEATAQSGTALARGDAITCTASHTVTQAEFDTSTEYTNSATATGQDPGANTITDTDSVTTPLASPGPKLTVDKTVVSPTPEKPKVGDTISYQIVVTNTGNVTLTGVDLADPNATLGTCTQNSQTITLPVTLAPSGTFTCTASHTVTQADFDTTRIYTNTAKATGKDPDDGTVEEVDSTGTPLADVSGALTVAKTSVSPTPTKPKVGDTISYEIVVTNSGNVTLTGVDVSDPKATLGTCTQNSQTITLPVTLAPTGTFSCTAEHTVTQANVDTGSYANTATATGKDPGNTTISDDDTVTTPLADAAGALTVTKQTVSPTPTKPKLGDTISYEIVVTNSGNVTMTGVDVSDPKATLSTCTQNSQTITLPVTLAPSGTFSCTAEHTVTQANVDAGSYANTATGKDPSNTSISDDDTVTTPLADAAGALTVTKQTVSPTPTKPKLGDTISYEIVVTNTGNVTLTGVDLTDPNATLGTCTQNSQTITLPVTLAPSGTFTCTANHTVTQANVDAGSYANTATATGKDPGNNTISDDDTVTTPLADAAGALTVTKQTVSPTPTKPKLGDTISYEIVVTNTGNVTLTGVDLTDPNATLGTCTQNSQTITLPKTLAPSGTFTCTANHTVTQANVDAGSYANTATATGKDPANNTVTDDDTVITTLVDADAKLSLVKATTVLTFHKAGEQIDYTFTVSNTGNVSVTKVTVTDPLMAVDCGTDPIDLAPGDDATCTGTYSTTAGDVEAGKVVNTAAAGGTAARGPDPSATSNKVVVPLTRSALTVIKTVEQATYSTVGDVLSYTVSVTNSGQGRVTDVTLSDPLITLVDCSLEGKDSATPTASSMDSDDTLTCAGTYVVTQKDVDSGIVRNVATATGKDPVGDPVSDSDAVESTGPEEQPSISVEVTPDPGAFDKVDQPITYSFTVRNTGNVTLRKVTVNAPSLDVAPRCPSDVLAPNEPMTCTAVYVTTSGDVKRGRLTTPAAASGLSPQDRAVSGEGSSTIPGPDPVDPTEPADLRITKTTEASVLVNAQATFRIVVVNRGPGTAKDVEMRDTLPTAVRFESASGTGWSCSRAERRVRCLLQQPLAAGTEAPTIRIVVTALTATSVVNTASVASTTPDPDPGNNVSSATLRIDRLPQEPTRAVKAERRAGILSVKTGKWTNAGRQMKTQVWCKPMRRGQATAAGEVSYCKVRKHAGGVTVLAIGREPMKVRVALSAPGTKTYRPFRKVSTWVVNPRGDRA